MNNEIVASLWAEKTCDWKLIIEFQGPNTTESQKHTQSFKFCIRPWVKIVGQLRPSIVRKMLKLWDFALSLIKA